jgi:hypothetical protein
MARSKHVACGLLFEFSRRLLFELEFRSTERVLRITLCTQEWTVAAATTRVGFVRHLAMSGLVLRYGKGIRSCI